MMVIVLVCSRFFRFVGVCGNMMFVLSVVIFVCLGLDVNVMICVLCCLVSWIIVLFILLDVSGMSIVLFVLIFVWVSMFFVVE